MDRSELPVPTQNEILSAKMKEIRASAKQRAKDWHSAYGDALVCEMTSEILSLMHDRHVLMKFVEALSAALEDVIGQRDDLMDDLTEFKMCEHCVHAEEPIGSGVCWDCDNKSNWVWEGAKEDGVDKSGVI